MMLLLVLGAFIFGAFILGAILFLIYLLWELFYEAMGVESQPRPQEPLDEEERLISQNISSAVPVDLTVLVESQPRSEEPLDEGEPLISQNISFGYAYPCKQNVQLSCTSGETNFLPPCDGARPSFYTFEAAKRGYFTSLKTAFNAVEEFVFGDNPPSDSD
ncbi:hypothetical protein F2Q69_00000935 [Brassica cretica]|uniref:Uncharacterized protein n=1 Tax=Brassica cretica TaxID=69181 RepID=A0A8S9P2G8_BRACR|nr:hypothetical protein F2Q69_00000935 [Brassica cretica]